MQLKTKEVDYGVVYIHVRIDTHEPAWVVRLAAKAKRKQNPIASQESLMACLCDAMMMKSTSRTFTSSSPHD